MLLRTFLRSISFYDIVQLLAVKNPNKIDPNTFITKNTRLADLSKISTVYLSATLDYQFTKKLDINHKTNVP